MRDNFNVFLGQMRSEHDNGVCKFPEFLKKEIFYKERAYHRDLQLESALEDPTLVTDVQRP